VVRGVDVNPSALARAAAARYTPWSLRETSPETRACHFRPSGREYLLAPEVRAAVVFEQRNLAAEHPAAWAELGRFDAIFCRNLLMYLTREAACVLVGRLVRALLPGGYLFLGHAETLRGLSDELELQHTDDTFYYRRGDQPRTLERELGWEDGWDDGWVDDISRATARIRALTAAESPGPSAARAAGDAQAALDAVVALLGDERLADARDALAALAPEIAESSRGLLIRAVLASHGDDLAAAERLCDRLLEMNDRDAGARFLKALCAQRTGDLPAAREGLRRAAALDPSFAMPRLHLGLLARRAHETAAARRELECALPLLEREDQQRLSLFGGGFGRAALLALCRAELAACAGAS
jgi:chemotaxis protein methyltransferase CheR